MQINTPTSLFKKSLGKKKMKRISCSDLVIKEQESTSCLSPYTLSNAHSARYSIKARNTNIGAIPKTQKNSSNPKLRKDWENSKSSDDSKLNLLLFKWANDEGKRKIKIYLNIYIFEYFTSNRN